MNVSSLLMWLLSSTCQVGLLICLVLGLQWVLRHRLSVRARYSLWLLVVIRMALPWAPQSRLSLYSLLPDAPRRGYEALMAPEGKVSPTSSAERDEMYAAGPLASSGSVAYDTPSPARPLALPRYMTAERITSSLVFFWLAGACALGITILASNLRIWRRLRRLHLVSDPEVLALLDDCQRQMGTGSPVRIVLTDQVNGPALFGLIRPCLLLPTQALAQLKPAELRYVFLHELAHLKRHDIPISALTSALHVLHWFNPLVAYGLQCMRTDRELACDGLALSRLQPQETAAYGRTVLRLIEQSLASRQQHPILAAFLGDQGRIKQRVAMISGFRCDRYRWSPLAVALVGLVGCIGLTNGRVLDRDMVSVPPVAQPAELHEVPAPTCTNSKRLHIRHQESGQYLVTRDRGLVCDTEPGAAGLWEARFNGEFTADGEMFLYSVSANRYLSTDGQGNLTVDQLNPEPSARWFRQSGPLGVQVISRELKNAYIRLSEQDQVNAVVFGRDLRSQWDLVQLE